MTPISEATAAHAANSNIRIVDDKFMRDQWTINVNRSRDSLLTRFGRSTLDDRYLLKGESYQDRFANVARAGGSNEAHAQRIYRYMSKHWFMPATPVLSNMGADRGLPISCFTKEAEDSLDGIFGTWTEAGWLAAKGGGLGTYWGNIRSIGESINDGNGETSGVIPFITVTNYQSMAIGQGSLRRGSEAAYLPVWHPEIEEFIDIRRVQGGAPERKSPNLHHGIMVTDDFMEAVATDDDYGLKSPKTGEVIKTIKARELWIKMITTRLEQGEPYLVFYDTINQKAPAAYRELGNKVKLSNLCSEITLTTGKDHLGNDRTGVCCLSSVNLTYYDEFKNDQQFFDDIAEFLDNVIEYFIQNAPKEMSKAAYAAMRERSIGIGVMGFHTALQKHHLAFGSPASRHFNIKVFHNINGRLEVASEKLADERGPAPDNADIGLNRRFVHKMAVAPTASISVIAGGASPGIDPITANVFTQKTLSGSFSVRNRELEKLLESKGQNTDKVWSSITTSKGSVQHLDFLTDHEKAVFKTAYELNQCDIVDLAADRADYIDQAQSVNLFLPADVDKSTLNSVHFRAWAKGCKSLYYCRSMSIQRADTVSKKVDVGNILEESNETSLFGAADTTVAPTASIGGEDKYEVCESCQ